MSLIEPYNKPKKSRKERIKEFENYTAPYTKVVNIKQTHKALKQFRIKGL